MNDDQYTKRYWVAVLREQIELTWIWLLIRLGLKKITIQERYDLNMRKAFIRKAAEGFKK